jgi:hypothetical protein
MYHPHIEHDLSSHLLLAYKTVYIEREHERKRKQAKDDVTLEHKRNGINFVHKYIHVMLRTNGIAASRSAKPIQRKKGITKRKVPTI